MGITMSSLQVLSWCPMLKTLQLSQLFITAEGIPEPETQAPATSSLCSLQIVVDNEDAFACMSFLFTVLTLPALSSITVSSAIKNGEDDAGEYVPLDWPAAQFSALLSRSGCDITALSPRK